MLRTSKQIKEQLIKFAEKALTRPSMFGRSPAELESYFWQNITLLLFIDRRESEFEGITKKLQRRGRYSASGIIGALKKNKHLITYKKIAAVFAPVYREMGYVRLPTSKSRDCDSGGWQFKSAWPPQIYSW
jgi:hypothetical protein